MSISQGSLIAASDINNHINNKSNPHGVTAAQVGAAASSHNHAASNITSGTLPVARGGTGVTSLSALKTSLGVSAPTLVDVKSVTYIGGSRGLTVTVKACDYVEIYQDTDPTDSFYTGNTVNTYVFDYSRERTKILICTVYKGNSAYYYNDDGRHYTVSFSSNGTTLTFDEDSIAQYCTIYCYTGGNICGTAALYLRNATTYTVPSCARLTMYTVYGDVPDVGSAVIHIADVVAGGSAVTIGSTTGSDYQDKVTLNSAGTTLTYDYADENRYYRNIICYSN